MTDRSDTPLFGDLPLTPPQEKPLAPLKKPMWTEQKAKLIAAYLRLFTFVTRHGAYIDGFAGPQNPDDESSWSARLALQNEPRWLRQFALCDIDPVQVSRLRDLLSAQPCVKGRTVEVIPGDFNGTWREAFRMAKVRERTATFCVLDQRTFECAWSTVEGVARLKADGSHKVELFYFLPIKWFDRAVSELNDKSVVHRWWGGTGWSEFRSAGTYPRATMFSERLRSELGYAYVRPWPIRERTEGRSVMYFMIHATDHPAAPALMQRAYGIATATPDRAVQLEMDVREEIRKTPAQGEA